MIRPVIREEERGMRRNKCILNSGWACVPKDIPNAGVVVYNDRKEAEAYLHASRFHNYTIMPVSGVYLKTREAKEADAKIPPQGMEGGTGGNP